MRPGSVIVGAAVLLGGCAAPGSAPAGPRVDRYSAVASAAATAAPQAKPVPVRPAPARPGEASCAWGATPRPSLDASWDVNDAREQARRALLEQSRPTRRRGTVPESAVPGAEACVHALRITFSLLAAGSRTVPDERAVESALDSAGLLKTVVTEGPAFAASTGAACLYGTFTADGPAFTIGPLATDRSCP